MKGPHPLPVEERCNSEVGQVPYDTQVKQNQRAPIEHEGKLIPYKVKSLAWALSWKEVFQAQGAFLWGPVVVKRL